VIIGVAREQVIVTALLVRSSFPSLDLYSSQEERFPAIHRIHSCAHRAHTMSHNKSGEEEEKKNTYIILYQPKACINKLLFSTVTGSEFSKSCIFYVY
jgi:hypothetical protein